MSREAQIMMRIVILVTVLVAILAIIIASLIPFIALTNACYQQTNERLYNLAAKISSNQDQGEICYARFEAISSLETCLQGGDRKWKFLFPAKAQNFIREANRLIQPNQKSVEMLKQEHNFDCASHPDFIFEKDEKSL